MHKAFYASGFLYLPTTQQILLQQSKENSANTTSVWSLIGGKGYKTEHPHKTFHRIVHQLLKLKLNIKNIYPVYDYINNTQNTIHYVVYAEVTKAKNFSPTPTYSFSWVTFKQTLKMPFHPQTKQNIIVGERVVKAKKRDDDAKNMPLASLQK